MLGVFAQQSLPVPDSFESLDSISRNSSMEQLVIFTGNKRHFNCIAQDRNGSSPLSFNIPKSPRHARCLGCSMEDMDMEDSIQYSEMVMEVLFINCLEKIIPKPDV